MTAIINMTVIISTIIVMTVNSFVIMSTFYLMLKNIFLDSVSHNHYFYAKMNKTNLMCRLSDV